MNNCGNASPTSHVVAAVTTNHNNNNNNAISDNTNISNCITSNSNNSNNSATSTNNNYLHNSSNHSNYLMLPNHHQELHNHSPVHHQHQSLKHHTNNSSNGKTSVSNNFNKNLLQSTIQQQNSSGVLNVNNSIGSGSAKRTMDDVLKRLTNKMKGSSIREGRRQQQQQHQQQTSPSPTSGNRLVHLDFSFKFSCIIRCNAKNLVQHEDSEFTVNKKLFDFMRTLSDGKSYYRGYSRLILSMANFYTTPIKTNNESDVKRKVKRGVNSLTTLGQFIHTLKELKEIHFEIPAQLYFEKKNPFNNTPYKFMLSR